GPGRAVWADVAKGVCILLVVLWHVVVKHYLRIDWGVPPIPGIWGALTEQLLPLRMPLFFTISGVFAAGAVTRPWRVVRRSKVGRFLYLYAVWLLIHTAILALVPSFDTARAEGVADLLAQLTVTPSNLWYLYALAVYFALAKATRRLPVTLVLGGALVLSAVASAGLLETPGNRGGLYQNLFFFLAGMYFRPFVERLAATAGWGRLLLTGACYAGTLAAVAATGSQAWPGVWPVVCAVATVFGVTAAALLGRRAAPDRHTPPDHGSAYGKNAGHRNGGAHRNGAGHENGTAHGNGAARENGAGLGEALARLGRNTLPVYVIHMPLLALLHLALVPPLSAGLDGRLRLALAVAEPVLLTALVVWLCLLLHRLLLKLGATWLFDLPARRSRDRLPG
ncbi:acyltransferase family protein, partial [Streptosporangium sp. NPDC048865]|uniref:acyltransferase family protein n=1 Tax=Streptosporangium sp. NPDC048865 TaxID=3155766 RepID=UPI003446BCDA